MKQLLIPLLLCFLCCCAGTGNYLPVRTAALYPNLNRRAKCRLKAIKGMPERGAVVLFLLDGRKTPRRVAGLPGDTIHVEKGVLHVDQGATSDGSSVSLQPCSAGVSARCNCHIHWEKLGSRRYAVQSLPPAGKVGDARCDGNADSRPVKVPPGHLYLLADNRDAALDSRHLGPLPLKRVQTQVVACRR